MRGSRVPVALLPALLLAACRGVPARVPLADLVPPGTADFALDPVPTPREAVLEDHLLPLADPAVVGEVEGEPASAVLAALLPDRAPPDRARAIVDLAGGMDPLVTRAREAMETDLALACHLADWAFLADPGSPEVQQLVIDVYERRILDEDSNTQEMLIYLDAMTAVRQAQLGPAR